MPLYPVRTRQFYEKNGEKKMKWFTVGFLKETEAGKKYLHLNMFPQTEFFVFTNLEQTTDEAGEKQ
jgi:hypothetical protein